MTDDQNPWFSDANSDATPPNAPGQGAPAPQPAPGYGPQQYPQQPYLHQAPAGYQPYGQPGFGPIAQSNGTATTSMVLGIVGLVSLFFCYGVVSIVLGPIAFFMGRNAEKVMESSPGSWSNAGMAKAGWIMGLIQTILSVIALLAIAAFFLWALSLEQSGY